MSEPISPRNIATPLVVRAGARDLDDLLPLMRAYCDFYDAAPQEAQLLALSKALIEDSDREGVQLITRDRAGRAVGFATLFWTWSTTNACRVGVMNDLFVTETARGKGLAEQLICACRDLCAQRGARRLTWQTAPDNHRAQAVYERLGANREGWVDYWLPC